MTPDEAKEVIEISVRSSNAGRTGSTCRRPAARKRDGEVLIGVQRDDEDS